MTVHPDHLAPLVLSLVDAIIAVGPAPQTTIQKFADGIGQPLAWPAGLEHQKGKAVVWFPRQAEAPFSIEILPGGPSEFATTESTPKATCATAVSSFEGRGIATT